MKVAGRQALTFEDLAHKFIQAREPNLAPSTATEYRRMVACYIHESSLAGTRGPELSRAEVKQFLEGLARRAPVMGNRVYQLVRAVCRWSVREELLPSNPCEGLQRPRRERSRDRVLKDEEIVALWKALDGEPPDVVAEPCQVAGVVKALLLLGQRSSETIEMRRSDLDLAAKTWTIPGQFRKGGRTHVVPLSAAALHMIGDLSTKVDRVFEGVSAVNPERDWWDRGADGQYTLYEDDGISQDYLAGKGSWTRMTWNERSARLTIEPGPPGEAMNLTARRTFTVELIPGGTTRTVQYSGRRVDVRF